MKEHVEFTMIKIDSESLKFKWKMELLHVLPPLSTYLSLLCQPFIQAFRLVSYLLPPSCKTNM